VKDSPEQDVQRIVERIHSPTDSPHPAKRVKLSGKYDYRMAAQIFFCKSGW
jgi:hypothetical protein